MGYNDQQFKQLYQQNGIISQLSCPYNSQQNGRSGKHRHILGIVRSFLISASLPRRFLEEAILTEVYAIMSPLFYHSQQNFICLYCKCPTYTHFGFSVVLVLFPFHYIKDLTWSLDLASIAFLTMALIKKFTDVIVSYQSVFDSLVM